MFSPFEYHLRWKKGANLASRLFRSGEWGWVVTVDLYAGPPMSRGCGSAQQTTAEASLVEFPLAVSGFAKCLLDLLNHTENSLQWRHNENHGVPNHLHIVCLLNRLFRHTWKRTSKLSVTGLCEGNPPVTGGFPSITRKMLPFVSVIMERYYCSQDVSNMNMIFIRW